MGVEPTRPCGHWILSPARLPFRHFGKFIGLLSLFKPFRWQFATICIQTLLLYPAFDRFPRRVPLQNLGLKPSVISQFAPRKSGVKVYRRHAESSKYTAGLIRHFFARNLIFMVGKVGFRGQKSVLGYRIVAFIGFGRSHILGNRSRGSGY